MSSVQKDEGSSSSNAEPSGVDEATHTEGGAPTDKAHEEVGDGSLAGSVPAGLTISEMDEFAAKAKSESGTS